MEERNFRNSFFRIRLFLKFWVLTVVRPLRPRTCYTLNVFFVVSSTTLPPLRQLYHVEFEGDFEFVRMRMFKRLLQSLLEET